ncbi:PREDICTED: uncharacterized protein C10orf67 homolog, mitochondrial isoform X2 [Crocodylus porosus]|uniref:uncharacterized protein C10orf67 homolog, mitochondrial isoform X2 n=1 Tax=Crocodylus porosus TaxID=8502 RepID=UPI00093FEA5F|nr:PREDICTED: uncharacterized protein C10orf67 homolog, mitochondrial isoform X2 [Crocodylus porosus]
MSALSFGRGAWPGLGPELCPSEQTLELLALPCCLEELEAAARPSISDDLKIGYFVTDHATQTDITEVAELKELTNTTQTLVQLIDSLQQDFLIYKNVLCSQYEEKIQEHASNLCRHINDRLNDIEDFHKKREAQIRQSYQQQLSDALAVPRMDFEKHYFINEDTDSSVAEHMQVLMNKLLERDSKIQYLEAELQDYHEHECVKMIIFEDDDQEKKMLEKENEDFKQEVSRLYDMILHLENSLKLSEKENKKLDTKVRDMQLKMENDEKTVIKLITAHEEMKKELQNEKLLVKSLQFKEAKKDIETEVENKVTSTETKTAALQVEEKDTKQLKEVVESEHENIVSLEKKELQKREPQKGESQKGLISKKPKKTPSEKIIEKGDEKRALLAEIEKLRKSEGRERQHIESLKKEVEQVNRSWAKKFEILKKSLHAIKNEMFLRQSLQRQSASFNHATVSQTVAVPLCIETGSSEMKMDRGGLYVPSHLPQIPSQSSTERKEKKGRVTDVQITVGTEMYNLYEDGSKYQYLILPAFLRHIINHD